MKSRNSNIAKLFLLSCANAAILTAMPVKADIEINDILRHTPEYQALTPIQKINVIRGIQARDDFSDLFDELMPQERRLFNDEIREVNRVQATAPVLNGARERRAVLAAGAGVAAGTAAARVAVGAGAAVGAAGAAGTTRTVGVLDAFGVNDFVGNTAVETGRIEQEMALENKLQILEILAKADGANATAIKDRVKLAIHSNNIENLSTPLKQLKYIATKDGIDANDNLKVVSNYAETTLTKEAFENVFFGTNITEHNLRDMDIEVKYFEKGTSPLLDKFKTVAPARVKRKLLDQFKNYASQNLVDLESKQSSNQSSIPIRQSIMKLADPAVVVNYLEKMAKLKEAYIDNGSIKIVDRQGKLIDERGLKSYNRILKDAGLITQDLDGKKMQALINNFDALTMSDLALVLRKTGGEIRVDNEGLVGLGNIAHQVMPGLVPPPPPLPNGVVPPPPPPPPGGIIVRRALPVRDLSNLDSIGDDELKLAGYSLKAKEDAALGGRIAAPVVVDRRAAVVAVPLASSTDVGEWYNDIYVAKTKNNPNDLKNRILGAELDLGITIKTLLTLEEGKAPRESLELFSATNPDKAQLMVKAENILNRLKNDDLIKQILSQALNNKIASGAFYENLFDEKEHNAIDRLNYAFGKLPQNLQDHITLRSNEIKVQDELKDKKTIISRIDYVAKNENILGINSLNNEIERIVGTFDTLNFSDKLDLALNREDVKANIALTTKANEIDTQINNWINNNIVNLTVESKLESADLTILQNKSAPATLSKIYETAVDIKTELLKKELRDNAGDLSKASKTISKNNITEEVLNNFNTKMKALTPNTKDFSKAQIVKFLNTVSDEKVESVLKQAKEAKALVAGTAVRVVVPVVVLGAGGPPPPPPPPPPGGALRVLNFNGLGMDGLVRRMNSLKPIENLFPKKIATAAAAVAYIAPNSDIGQKYETAVKAIVAAADTQLKKELEVKTKGKEKLKALMVEEVFERYATKKPEVLADVNQLAQGIKEGSNIEFIGPKREIASDIDQETRNLCVRMNKDIGLMQQLKTSNPKLAAIIESVAINEEEVANRLPDSSSAIALANGDYNAVVVAPVAAPARRVIPLVVPAGFAEDDAEEEIAAPADEVIAPVALEPVAVEDGEVLADAGVEADLGERREGEEAPEILVEEGVVAPALVSAPAPALVRAAIYDTAPKSEELAQQKAKEEEATRVAIESAIKRAEEAKIIEELLKAVEDSAMQTAVKEDKEIIGAMHNTNIVHNIHHMNSDMVFNRMKNTALSFGAVAAGDEDERVLDKGAWIAGIYGVNKQGSQKGFAGYKGHASGGTVGFDIGFDNFKDLVGIAYTKLDSKFKSTGNKLNTDIDSHIIALYGQKELPKNFTFQGMFAYNHNIVKSKVNRLGKIASGKYKNDSYNFEGLLSYNYRANNNITLTPNAGIRYGHIKDGTYEENGVGIQHLSIASKKQHVWAGILGGSVALAPQKIVEGISITPTLHGSVENYFNRKSKKLDTKVKWKDRELEQSVELPKQPKIGYNIGGSVLAEKGNISVTLEYNCHLQKKYQSHQGFVKLKVKL